MNLVFSLESWMVFGRLQLYFHLSLSLQCDVQAIKKKSLEKKTSLDKEAIPNDFLFHQLPQQSHILYFWFLLYYWDCFKEVETLMICGWYLLNLFQFTSSVPFFGCVLFYYLAQNGRSEFHCVTALSINIFSKNTIHNIWERKKSQDNIKY